MRIIGSASCLSMRHSKARVYHCSGFLLFVGSVVSSSTAVGRHLPKKRSVRRAHGSFTVACHPAIRRESWELVADARWSRTLLFQRCLCRVEGLLGNEEYVCVCACLSV